VAVLEPQIKVLLVQEAEVLRRLVLVVAVALAKSVEQMVMVKAVMVWSFQSLGHLLPMQVGVVVH